MLCPCSPARPTVRPPHPHPAGRCGSRVLTELSPFLGAEGFLGNRISLERYSLSRCTLACRDSVHLFRCLGSTEIPMVRATFLWMPGTLSSSRLKPLPARTFVWYLTVGHLTTGRRGPDAGRGAMRRALACRALRLRREKPSGDHCPPSRSGPDARRTGKDRTGRDGTGALAPGRSPTDLASRLVKPRGHAPLPVLVEVGLQDHAILARRHGCGRKASSEGSRPGKKKACHFFQIDS